MTEFKIVPVSDQVESAHLDDETLASNPDSSNLVSIKRTRFIRGSLYHCQIPLSASRPKRSP